MKCGTGRRMKMRRMISSCLGAMGRHLDKTAHVVRLEHHWKLGILNHADLSAKSRRRSKPASTLHFSRPIPTSEQAWDSPLELRVTDVFSMALIWPCSVSVCCTEGENT
jgi:hypothetical protein